MRTKKNLQNIDLSDPDYLEGRIKDNTGAGGGTPVSEYVYGDLHQNVAKLLHLYGIQYNDLPDNESNGYQLVEALKALASKNDYILPVTANGDILNIPIKIGKLKTGESFVCKAALDKPAATNTVKGTLDNSTKAAIFSGDFKENDYVRVINNADNVEFVRLVDYSNFEIVAKALNFLQKATQTQENTGTSEEVATTPKTNKTVFAKRVNGEDSDDYLASEAQNGLLSKEDKTILNGLGNLRLRNVGFFAGVDPDTLNVGATYATGGDITRAEIVQRTGSGNLIEVTFKNAMQNNSYKLHCSVESQANIEYDNDIRPVIWKPVSTTKARVYIEESAGESQNLKIHIDAIQL